MNTTEFLNITSLIVPDRTAIVFDGKRFSFQELEERVKKLANALAGMGVRAGDRIASMQVNCNENIETYFAAAKLDAVYVPLNFRSRPEEIEYMINKFLDLINPSEAPSEVVDLSEPALVLIADSGGFTEEELDTLSNDELIEIAKEKGLEDILVLDADGNLQNRDEVIKALVESEALKESAT